MRIFPSSRDVPELAALPEVQRSRIWRKCLYRAMGHWISFCSLALSVVVFLVVLHHHGPLPAIVIGSAIEIAREYFVLFYVARRYVTLELPKHCARCGYDLRGSAQRCPECGTVAADAKTAA